MAKLIYGSDMRLTEFLRLRVKGHEFDRRALIVRDGKGAQDRVKVLPDSLIPLLKEHLQRVKALHEHDLARGYGAVYLPDVLQANMPTPIGNGAGNTSSRPARDLLCSSTCCTSLSRYVEPRIDALSASKAETGQPLPRFRYAPSTSPDNEGSTILDDIPNDPMHGLRGPGNWMVRQNGRRYISSALCISPGNGKRPEKRKGPSATSLIEGFPPMWWKLGG